MTTKLATILADFTTNLATAIIIGGTTATLQSATDDDAIALPSGRYFFTIDGENSNKEHFSCDLVGTSLTNLQSISRQGVESAGAVRPHRIGATVSLTDFAHIKYLNDLLSGTTMLNSLTPLEYDGVTSITNSNQLATKAYVDGVAVAGAPDADTTTKGLVEEATQAEVDARTTTGGTGAKLFAPLDKIRSSLLSDYVAVDSGSANAYAIAPTPAITAYAAGQRFVFKVANANTDTSTLAVSGLASPKTIKKNGSINLSAGDLAVGQIVEVIYDGTNFLLLSPVVSNIIPAGTISPYAGSSAPTGWVLADGSAISRTTYATLFALISTTYGVGDGVSTFNVPNLKGKIPVGLDAAQTEFDTLAETGGAKTHQLTTAEMPAHTHTMTNIYSGAAGFGNPGAFTTSGSLVSTGSTGGDGAHNNLQPYLVINYIIKT